MIARSRFRVLAMALTSLGLAAAGHAGKSSEVKPAERKFRFSYQAVAPAIPEQAGTAYLWIPYPPDTPEQSIKHLAIDTDLEHDVVTEPRYGDRAIRVKLKPGSPAATVTLRFEVTRHERLNRPGEGKPQGKVGLAPEPEKWLGADARVPLDGQIAKWARETVGEKTEPLDRERAIYDYVVTNLKYDKSGTGWGRGDIYWACDQKRGNCTDFHSVFIGYSRSLGIPARFEMGFPIPPDRGKGEIAGYHCWAQFHLADRGWVPIDASEASKHPEKRAYFFGAHDENRVLFTVGRDVALPGMKGEPLNFFIYPYGEVDGKPLEGIEKHFAYEDLGS